MSTRVRLGRPRDVEIDRALCAAALDLLAEVGYDKLSIDAVAARCGAGKSTVYRRWPGKAELTADAVALLPRVRTAPDTGSLRGDLLAMASSWLDPDVRRDAVIAGLLTAMARDARLREAVHTAVSVPYQASFTATIAKAAERGEVPMGLDLELLGAVFPALVRYLSAAGAVPISRDVAERIIDCVLLPALKLPALNVPALSVDVPLEAGVR